MNGRVIAVCVGEARPVAYAGPGRSAIDKRPVAEPVWVTTLGLSGDEQADRRHHGGPDQAVYAYAEHDADHWRQQLERDLPPGSFGENLRLRDVEVSRALVGTQWQIGGARLQAAAPRIPCRVFAGFWDVPDLVKRFLDAGRPGAYLRVLSPGAIAAGDTVEVVAEPDHDVTIAEVARILTHEPERAHRLLGVDGLAEAAAAWAAERARASPRPSPRP